MFKNSYKSSQKPRLSSTQKIAETETSKNSYIFVPYWTLDQDILNTSYSKLIYFGITANSTGIDINEPGYKKLSEFVKNTQDKEIYLAVRLLDPDTNIKILNSLSLQKKVIDDALNIVSSNNFRGVVLDLELSALPFESLITKITSFNREFASLFHAKNLSFGTLLYGDTYFRIRPFDVAKIGKVSDQVFMMAYDFSKSQGSPGPGFPFDSDTYGYNFKTMVTDFKKDVSSDKLIGVVGMFGYDWIVDVQERSKKPGEAKTTLQFEKFLTQCISDNSCTSENSTSGMKITYKDENGEKHVIWFEISDSAKNKTDYLSSQNINSVAYWAYGYH